MSHGEQPVRSWALAAVLAVALFAVPLPPWAVDQFYSRDLYPWLQSGLTAASNATPVAVFDLLVALAGLVLLYRLARLTVTASRSGAMAALREGLQRLIRLVALIVVAFMFFWGCNYRRVPLAATLSGGAAVELTEDGLLRAVTEAAALASRVRPAAAPATPGTFDELAGMLAGPMNRALTRLNREPLARAGRPKVSRVLTPFFTRAGVDGMINPLALESIVHPDLLPFERPYVLAHEWGHLAGLADEAEASAVGWLACMSGPPPLVYSASLYLVMEGAAALPGEARTKALASLSAGVRADLEAIRTRLMRQQPQVQQVTSRVYDTYLRANRVPDGTASYSRALRLILSPPLREALY